MRLGLIAACLLAASLAPAALAQGKGMQADLVSAAAEHDFSGPGQFLLDERTRQDKSITATFTIVAGQRYLAAALCDESCGPIRATNARDCGEAKRILAHGPSS